MPATRIHRYLLREIALPAGLGLAVFTFVLLAGRMLRLADMVISKGVPPGDIARLILFLLPSFLVLTLPLAVLLGILSGFGRLSAESEIVALKSSGFSLYGLVKPALLLAFAATAATAFLTLYAEPAGNTAFRSQVFQLAASRASIGFQPRVFNDDFDGLVLYANEIEERSGAMQDIFISDERVGTAPATILAARGRILSDRDSLTLILRLEDGSIHRRSARERDSYQVVRFTSYDLQLSMGPAATPASRSKKPKELTLAELREGGRRAASPAERQALAAQLHRRLTLPLAPLLFALVAVPLGIQSQRSGRGGSFALGLAVFLIYYLLNSLAQTLTVEGGLPVATMWVPSLLFLGGGLYLLHLSAQEKRLLFLDLWVETARRIARRFGRKVQA